ncbi:MAG TPA: sulfotransferase, partial [Caulobacteraceae bacterium]
RAKALAVRARTEGAGSPVVHHLAALDLQDAGRFEDAIIELGLGLQLQPDHAGMMTSVGYCLLELGRRQEAANVLGAAMARDPSSVMAIYGYGCAAERLGALKAAESAFNRVLQLKPDHADAVAGLSGLAVRRRDWETARSLAEKAAAIEPRQTDALMNLARIDLGLGAFLSAERRLNDIVALPYLPPAARADAIVMLGDSLDGQRRFAEAFEAYGQGKQVLNARYQTEFGGGRSAPDGARQILEEFLGAPEAAWVTPPPTKGSERGHAFLLGFARSGTTLLEQILSAHPDVEALGERPLMLDAELEFLTRPGGVTRLADVFGDMLEPYRAAYWARVRSFDIDPAGKVFVDKHPLATVRLPLIHKLFPRARVVFVIRDPRDVVFSCFRRNFNINAASYEFDTVERAAVYYDAVMEAGETYFARLPIQVLKIRYEDLVADFDVACQTLCNFLEVPWNETLRTFAASAGERRIATPSSTQVGRGLYEGGVGQWRNYPFALEPALPILERWIDRFGYDPQ